MSFRTNRFRFGNRRFNLIFTFTDVDFDHLEVFHIGDETIVIFVNTLENELADVVWETHTQKLVCIVNESVELFKGHFSFRSF